MTEQGDELPEQFDVISYVGQINRAGYELLCQELKAKKKASVALLILGTPGGDPHAGFRIARALGHAYDHFYALVPTYCKSAGTLILVGAKRLYLDDMSELGPLDVQVKKGDEVVGRNSGLEFIKAVQYLQTQSMEAFSNYLVQLTSGVGLSTRVASDIAARLTEGLFEPIAAQIDPLKLAEMQRATEIAFEYGTRLAEKSGNMRSKGLARLVAGYPAHGFVIDRKEAKLIFVDVKRPEGMLAQISEAFQSVMWKDLNNEYPQVNLQPIGQPEQTNDQAPADPTGATASAAPVQPADGGDSPSAAQGVSDKLPDPNLPDGERAPTSNEPAGPPEAPDGVGAPD